VALDPGEVETVGELDERPVISSYLVRPVVGLVRRPPASFGLEAREVSEAFEVPLDRFALPGVRRSEWWDASRLPPGTPPRPLADLDEDEVDRTRGRYRVWFYDVSPDRVIWGLTARVLKDLLERLAPRS
jgi:hypothetical protein